MDDDYGEDNDKENHDDDDGGGDHEGDDLHVAIVSGERKREVQRERPPSHSEDYCFYKYYCDVDI